MGFGYLKQEGIVKPSNFERYTGRLNYDNYITRKLKRGTIFTTDLDITNPLGSGITSRKLYINKNGSTSLRPSTNKYATVAQYTAEPFVNGYTSKANIKRVSNSAAIIISPNGAGQAILFADDPTYRGYWLGTNRIFLNAIFFANLTAIGGGIAGEE